MISVKQLLYKLDLRLNKKTSLEHQGIPLEDKILALNEAQIKLVKKKIDTNNNYQDGLDAFKKRYQDLENLMVQFEKLAVKETKEIYPSYEADISTTKYKYFLPLDMYILCNRGTCTNRVVTITRTVKHGDLATYMSNTHYAPSFEYQETFAVLSGNKLIAYTDGSFYPTGLYLTYLKYPQKIDFEGYIDLDGNDSITQDSELEDYLEDELLDLAVLELAMDTENVPQIQYAELRNKTNE